MISRGWSFDLNRVTTEQEFDVPNGLITTHEAPNSLWSIQFYTKEKFFTAKGGFAKSKKLSLNGKLEEFIALRNILNVMIGNNS